MHLKQYYRILVRAYFVIRLILLSELRNEKPEPRNLFVRFRYQIETDAERLRVFRFKIKKKYYKTVNFSCGLIIVAVFQYVLNPCRSEQNKNMLLLFFTFLFKNHT